MRTPVSTTVHVRFGPTRKRPTSSSGFCVARQPDPLHVAPGRLGEPLEREREVRAALGLRDRVDLVDDHLLGARRRSRAPGSVSIRYSDSGVVIRMSGGWRTMSRRSFCGVSPVRIADA